MGRSFSPAVRRAHGRQPEPGPSVGIDGNALENLDAVAEALGHVQEAVGPAGDAGGIEHLAGGPPPTLGGEPPPELAMVTAEDVEGIAGAKSLKNIELGFVGASSESVASDGDMRKWEQLKRLERVHLCKEKIVDNDLAFVAKLPVLKDLEFNAQAPGLREDAPKC